MNELLTEFAEECRKIFGLFEQEEVVDSTGENGDNPYPELNTQNRGGRVVYDSLESEISKALQCDKTAIKLLGVLSGLDYYKFISCMKWFCEKCGSKDGRIHKKRLSGILGRLNDILEEIDLRQFVFTVPESWRCMFESRKAINSLIKMVEKIIKEKYPGKRCIAYFHAFGDKDRNKYNPHVNIHVIEDKGQELRLDKNELDDLKNRFKRALIGFGCRGEEKMNVWYQFYKSKFKILHKLKYMARPCPGYINFPFVRRSKKLSNLFVLEMKGFCYIRYFNGFAYCKQKDVDRKEEIKEAESLAGEPLKFIKDGEISKSVFDMKYMPWDYEKLSDTFYRINASEGYGKSIDGGILTQRKSVSMTYITPNEERYSTATIEAHNA